MALMNRLNGEREAVNGKLEEMLAKFKLLEALEVGQSSLFQVHVPKNSFASQQHISELYAPTVRHLVI
jgi:hypothetical protein